MSLFAKKLGSSHDNNQVDRIIKLAEASIDPMVVASPAVSKAALSMESISDNERTAVSSSYSTVNAAIESIARDLGMTGFTMAQKEAAIAATMIAGNAIGAGRDMSDIPSKTSDGAFVVNMSGLMQGVSSSRVSMEAYDERENRRSAFYSLAYNLITSRQDDFCEAFFKTVVVSPDNFGIEMVVKMIRVFSDRKRNVDGSVTDFEYKNVLRAFANPNILKSEQTRMIPVVRPLTVQHFVDPALVPPYAVNNEGIVITTAPLATGKTFDIVSLSENDELLATGTMDHTDTIEPNIILSRVYMSVGAPGSEDVLSFDVSQLNLANFTYATQDNYRAMSLNFSTTSPLVNKDSVQHDNSALVQLAPIVAGDYVVRLSILMNGTVNIQKGDMAVFGNEVRVSSVRNAAGDLVALTDPSIAAWVTLINTTGKIFGYDQRSYRSNVNMFQRGQLVETTENRYIYPPVLTSPFTYLHPVSRGGENDASDLKVLITLTQARTSNLGVTALIRAANTLKSYVDSRDTSDEGPEIFGIGRFYVRPVYFDDVIDMAVEVDSLKSQDREQDICAVLVNRIRNFAYRMYRDSEYQPAANALFGGEAPLPEVIVGTDPVTARYLMVTGDLRTLSNNFNVRIVQTLDERVKGKLFITFGNFNEGSSGTPDPLHFGMMVWKPELTVVLPITRENKTSKELTVQPNQLHIPNLPVMTVIEVKNIPDVLGKVPLYQHIV